MSSSKFERLHWALQDFTDERPIMKKNNEPKVMAKLLAREADELKVELKKNKFKLQRETKPGIYEPDLKAVYEIADIIIFAINFIQKIEGSFDEIPTQYFFQQPEEQLLIDLYENIGSIKLWAADGLPNDYILPNMRDTIRCGIMLLSQLDLDPVTVCMEKIGFNILRYGAFMFQEGDFDTQRGLCRKEAERLRLVDQFESPLPAVVIK